MIELVERASQLSELAALLAEATAGHGHVAFIGGEAGIGKSALVETFCHAHAEARVLSGACDSLSTPRPLGPLLDMARQTRGPLQRLLSSSSARESIFTALLDELAGVPQPTVLIFEDVHWSDEATLDLLRFLARRLGPLPVLVVATYRDDEVGHRHPLRLLLGDLATTRTVHRLSLPALSLEAVRVLAHGSVLDAAALHRRTAGNPFFVVEALATGDEGIPATVRDAILTRAARLSEPARDALEAAAVLGFRVETTLLTSLLGAREAALDECVGVGFLRAEGAVFSFRHELARQAVHDAISPRRRADLHRLALENLRTTSDDPDGLARLAHHAEMAGDREAVLAYAPAAAKRAVELKAHREATEQYARALRWTSDCRSLERAPLLEGFADHCQLTDRHAEAVGAWNEALEIRRRQGDRRKEGEILRLLARPLWYLGRSREAETSVRAALRVLEPLPPGPELGWTFSELGRLAMTSGQRDAALAWSEKAIGLAEQLGDQGLMAHALNNIGSTKLDYADERGFDDLERSLLVALAANLEDYAGRTYTNLASTAFDICQLPRAERWLEDGLTYTLDHDVETYRLCLTSQLPMLHLRQGRWTEAADEATALLSRPDLSPLYRLRALTTLGQVRARRGDPETWTALDEALALADLDVDLARSGAVQVARVEAALLASDRRRAEAELHALNIAGFEPPNPWAAGELALWRWRLDPLAKPPANIAEPYAQRIAGDWAGAAASWEALGCPYEAAEALADRKDEATLRRALAEFERLGARPMAALVTRRLHELGARGFARGPRPTTRANPAWLTSREMETWRLLAEGLRNAEIADRLSVSTKTIDHHVSAVLAKLGVRSRVEAAKALTVLDVDLRSEKLAQPN